MLVKEEFTFIWMIRKSIDMKEIIEDLLQIGMCLGILNNLKTVIL